MRLRNVMVVGYAAALFVVAPATAATAVYSYEGSDYSYDGGSTIYMYTCDREADSRAVYAQYTLISGENLEVRDTDGSNGNCHANGPYYKVDSHRTCEAIALYPDQCGTRKYN